MLVKIIILIGTLTTIGCGEAKDGPAKVSALSAQVRKNYICGDDGGGPFTFKNLSGKTLQAQSCNHAGTVCTICRVGGHTSFIGNDEIVTLNLKAHDWFFKFIDYSGGGREFSRTNNWAPGKGDIDCSSDGCVWH